MPLVSNQIDAFAFISLDGNPQALKKQLTPLARAGVDGTTLLDEGSRGRAFTLRSKVDQANVTTGWRTLQEYKDLIGTDPVDLIWNDAELSEDTVQVAVLDVTLARLVALAGGTGGLNPPSLAWLECDWTLLPIDVSTPAPAP